ncbi:MAG: hypothetical protein WDN28_07905 [Chthoniobacter sp.]
MRLWPAILLLLALAGLLTAAEPDGTMKLSIPKDVTRPLPGKIDRIWSGVIVATNPENPKEPPPELREFAERLKRVFGYTQFELAGSATEEIDELTENWLVPSPIFPLSVRARRAPSKEARGGYLLNLNFSRRNARWSIARSSSPPAARSSSAARNTARAR